LKSLLPPGKPDLKASVVDEAQFEATDIALVSKVKSSLLSIALPPANE
jgi:hypothetical protein